MSKRRWVFGSVAVVLVLMGLAVRFVGDPVLVRFPLNVDQKMQYRGTVTVMADPSTMAPLATPMVFPLTVNRTVKVVSGTYSRAVVDETTALTFAGSTQTTTYRYLMDRRTMKTLDSPQSYALGNRSFTMTPGGTYRINFPLGTSSSHSYGAFAPETGSAATATPTGPAHHSSVAGVDVITFNTALDHAVTPYYLSSLQKSGFPSQLTAAQAAAQLKAKGADLTALVQQVAPFLSSAQMTQLQQALAQPVPLSYRYFQQGQVQVEPTTGAVLSAGSTREGVSVSADLTGLKTLVSALAPLDTLPAVQALDRAAAALTSAGPQVAISMSYAQTPASVQAVTATAVDQAHLMSLIRWQLPLALVALGIVSLLLAVLWRPRRPAPVTELPVTATVQPPVERPMRRPA